MKYGIRGALHTTVPFRVGIGPVESIQYTQSSTLLIVTSSALGIGGPLYTNVPYHRVDTGPLQSAVGKNGGQNCEVPYIPFFLIGGSLQKRVPIW